MIAFSPSPLISSSFPSIHAIFGECATISPNAVESVETDPGGLGSEQSLRRYWSSPRWFCIPEPPSLGLRRKTPMASA